MRIWYKRVNENWNLNSKTVCRQTIGHQKTVGSSLSQWRVRVRVRVLAAVGKRFMVGVVDCSVVWRFVYPNSVGVKEYKAIAIRRESSR